MEITGNRVVLNLVAADNMKHVEPGDVISHLRSFQGGLETSGLRGKVSQAYTVIRPRQHLNSNYYKYLFKADRYVQALRVTTNQLRDGQSIRFAELRQIPLPVPPLDEQRTISDYLERETTQIDELVEKQTLLIERLRERRDEVVDQSVFGVTASRHQRDLPPLNGQHLAVAPLLRLSPQHWPILRFKVLLQRSDARNTDLSVEMVSLRITGELVPRAADRQEPNEASLPRYLVAYEDDLVVNPMWLVGGAVGVATRDGAVSPDYRVFKVGSGLLPRYLHHLLRSTACRAQYALYARAQTTFDRRVQQPDLDNLPLPVPPLNEQQEIVNHLDRETAKIDELISKTERFIELTRERRAALITAAVTGQLDVSKKGAA